MSQRVSEKTLFRKEIEKIQRSNAQMKQTERK